MFTRVREILGTRESAPVREATLDEIFGAPKEGGVDVSQISSRESEQRRGLAITLGKNSQTFHRVASGDWGLTAWYPTVKDKRTKNEDTEKDEIPAAAAGESPQVLEEPKVGEEVGLK